MAKFPSTIHVKCGEERDDSYFIATEEVDDLAEVGETIEVGIYTLKEIKKLSLKTVLSLK